MILRSSVARDPQQQQQPHAVDAVASVGSFVELRSDDSTTKPWLARILNTRKSSCNDGGQSEVIDEVECEWLWHPSECLKDFDLESSHDPSFYGSREVFASGGRGDSGRDWNPLDSIKYVAYVLPLEAYKQVAAAGFQMQMDPDDSNSSLCSVDQSRCWYYRQALFIDENNVKTLEPAVLPSTIHRPNAEYIQWCSRNGVSLKSQQPANIPNIPQRTTLVPENPERMYFYCSECQRRFETRQGDCIDPSLLHDGRFLRKAHIYLDDVSFCCPMCKESRGGDSAAVGVVASSVGPSPAKRARLNSGAAGGGGSELWASGAENVEADEEHEKADLQRRDNQRKQGRYDRVRLIFQNSIQEVVDAGQAECLLYRDAMALADIFFNRFEAYSSGKQLNTKMEHQKLHEIFQNVKRENNSDLRRRIVTGEMTIDELIAADVKDLAPESLKKRREAEQKKYFEQQVLLSTKAEKVIRKTHKGLEVVQGDETPRSSSVADTEEQDGAGGVGDGAGKHRYADDPSTSLPFSAASGDGLLTVEEIIKSTINSRRNGGPPDCHLIDLPLPVASLWKAAAMHLDPQLGPPPEFLGLPNRQQSRDLVISKLRAVNMTDKIISDVANYADTLAYR